jgi:Uma2 family endonuclease
MDGGATAKRAHLFTVADYHRMVAAGILGEDSRVELIRGQIVDMAPIGAPHLNMVIRLTRLLPALIGDRGVLSVQNPIRLDDGSEPQPDVAVLRLRPEEYETAAPRAADVLLVIEVADTTLDEDRDVKAPLYAESEIPEYWIVNLVDRVVEVYRQPHNGLYLQTRRVGADGVLDLVTLPDAALPARELLRRPAKASS